MYYEKDYGLPINCKYYDSEHTSNRYREDESKLDGRLSNQKSYLKWENVSTYSVQTYDMADILGSIII